MEYRRSSFFQFLFVLFFFTISAAGAAIPFTGYATRIERAQAAIGELIEKDLPAESLRGRISAIKRLVPSQQDVQFDGQVVRVDNSWLHTAIDEVAKKPAADTESRRAMLNEISDRLSALQERIRLSQQIANAGDRNAQLDRILARPEYQLDKERESTIKKFLYGLWEKILSFLRSLAFTSAGGPELPNTGLLSGFRILLVIIVLVALVIGAFHLTKRLRRKRQWEEVKDVREVLGEEMAGDVTSGDLLATAAELAKQGDYRTAIRRVYIALLLDLERRGKLPLHPSKTNRDYLNALRSERKIYPTFSTMTGTFEMTWYGQRGATEDEFNGFVSHYEDAKGNG
jgi:Domain of unknown function (DUF4129)